MRQRNAPPDVRGPVGGHGPSWAGHVQIARFDHWVKNLFVVPGIVTAMSLGRVPLTRTLLGQVGVGLLAVGLVASSNYVINELADAPFDRHHPLKRQRPVPSGQVSRPLAYGQWLVLMLAGVALGWLVSTPLMWTLLGLWLMGCVYNLPPLRSKDVAYVDVLSEAINNPLRMLAGWFMVEHATVVPGSLLLSYWMIGCYLMAIKRLAEYRDLANPRQAAAYRKSFRVYTEQRLLVSIMFYGAAAMLFFGAFIVRYRLELIGAFPFVALVMAHYLALAFQADSAVQRPEKLYREPWLLAAVVACVLVMGLLLLVDLPSLHWLVGPPVPPSGGLQASPGQGVR